MTTIAELCAAVDEARRDGLTVTLRGSPNGWQVTAGRLVVDYYHERIPDMGTALDTLALIVRQEPRLREVRETNTK